MSLTQKTPVVVIMQEGDRWWQFDELVRVVVAERADEVQPALADIEAAVATEQLFATGAMAYEAAAAYGLAVHPKLPDSPPLLWFGLFRGRHEIPPPAGNGPVSIGTWHAVLDAPAYLQAIETIKSAIAAGYTYQANFTFNLRAEFTGDTWALFSRLAAAQRSRYCAYIDMGRYVVCSASPELFFQQNGDHIESRPMKGTAHRGLTVAADQAQADWLHHSEKNRAENVMIVDMIRNDFGRIAHTGTVRVPELFTIEQYPTLLQMTSTVVAQTSASLTEIMAAVFPCASITGAPKVRTMSILRELEVEARGIYTGAVGFITPDRQAQFNVAIRTAVVDTEKHQLVYGVGSGVVWDSDPTGEYEECLLKARVLEAGRQELAEFQLLESLLWTPKSGYFFLNRHLARLAESAAYFGFALNGEEVMRHLDDVARRATKPVKVRLLVSRSGEIVVEMKPLYDGPVRPRPLRVGLAPQPVSSNDIRLYHKTTRREIYEQALASRPDCDEVILWNERGELTESCYGNLVLELNGVRYTPPVESGLLAGTFRAELLMDGDVQERILSPQDLWQASRIWLVNSVRGWQKTVLVDPPSANRS